MALRQSIVDPSKRHWRCWKPLSFVAVVTLLLWDFSVLPEAHADNDPVSASTTIGDTRTGNSENQIGNSAVGALASHDKPGANLPTSPGKAASDLNAPENVSQQISSHLYENFGKETETTLFDIYLGDKLKGSILADYTPDWFEISDPQAVIDQLQELKNAADLLPLVTGKIENKRVLEDIGNIKIDVNTFSIIVTVDPKFLGADELNLRRKAGSPENAFSVQQRLSAVAAGAIDGNSRHAFAHRSVASYGSYFAIADGAVVSDRAYELNQAVVGGIVGDYRVGAGLLQTQGDNFASSLQYTGVKVETAEDLFLDQDLIRGSTLEVFIPSRSRVEFYRDGRLLSVQTLDFGLREIDTSSFPQGSYDIDIIINDSFGGTTRQRKYFTKAGFLASRARPVFTLQAGSVRDGLTQLDIPVYQTGLRYRAFDSFDLGASLYGSDNIRIATLDSNGLVGSTRIGFGISASDDNDVGIVSSLGGTVFGLNYNGGIASTIRGGTQAEVLKPIEEKPFDPIFNLEKRRRELTFQDRTSRSLSVYRRIGDVEIRLAGESSSGDGFPKRHSAGPYLEWTLLESQQTTFRLQTSDVDTEDGRIFSTGALYGYKIYPNLVLAAQLAHRVQKDQNETILLTTLNYDGKSRSELGDRAVATNEIRQRKIDGSKGVTSVTNQVDVDNTSDYVRTTGFVRDARTSQTDSQTYGINATSSFLVASDGSLSVSHPVTQEGVFIAEVASKTVTSSFEILMNNQVMGTIDGGGKVVLGVAPYRTYEVKIRPVGSSDLVSYDSTPSKVTIFPGNVVKKKWRVEKVFIALGRIVDENGTPLARQRIKGPREYTVTEEDGSFQTEISGDEDLAIDNNQRKCKLDFSIVGRPEYYIDVGTIVCKDERGRQAI